jgi:NADH-quinone oxidoreductase subunit C
MLPNEVYDKLKNEFGDDILSINQEPNYEPFINVNANNLLDIMLFLRDEKGLEYDYLSCLSGMDYKENLGIVYHLFSVKSSDRIIIKVEVPKESPDVPTLEKVWLTADWHEREAYDMYGINFVGHHNLIRILSPYDWEGYPLRKDYKGPEEYHGIKVPY